MGKRDVQWDFGDSGVRQGAVGPQRASSKNQGRRAKTFMCSLQPSHERDKPMMQPRRHAPTFSYVTARLALRPTEAGYPCSSWPAGSAVLRYLEVRSPELLAPGGGVAIASSFISFFGEPGRRQSQARCRMPTQLQWRPNRKGGTWRSLGHLPDRMAHWTSRFVPPWHPANSSGLPSRLGPVGLARRLSPPHLPRGAVGEPRCPTVQQAIAVYV